MDGKNSTGRKVSLLNDFGGAARVADSPLVHSNINNNNTRLQQIKLPSLSSISISTTNSKSNNHSNRGPSSASSGGSQSQSPISASSPPNLSPQTPPLVRSESTDSGAFASTPSPVTPHFAPTFDHQPFPSSNNRQHQVNYPQQHHLHHQQQQQQQHQQQQQQRNYHQQFAAAKPQQHYHVPQYHHAHVHAQGLPHPVYYRAPSSYAKMDDSSASIYPPLPDAANTSVMAYPLSAPPPPPPPATATATATANAVAAPPSQPSHMRSSASPSSDAHASNGSGKVQPKKNQYPCPMAKEYQCTDFFTTSGHAARHAKKHTGKKDAFCPECNKAFTRKDNMEQHRRTHQNVRGPSKNPAGVTATTAAVNGSDNRVKKTPKQSRKSDNKLVAANLEAAVQQQLDEQRKTAVSDIQSTQPQQAPMTLPQALISAGSGPYFVHADPVQALPQPMPIDYSGRPPLYRSGYTNSLDFIPQAAPTLQDASDLHFNYPSPGLSNGLNTLALAASDHRRMSEEESNHSS